jgi:hypothetical protein
MAAAVKIGARLSRVLSSALAARIHDRIKNGAVGQKQKNRRSDLKALATD